MTNNKSSKIDRLVVNTDAFEAVYSEIQSNVDSLVPQPIMIIGEHGVGKSTLIHRLKDSLGDNKLYSVLIDGRKIFNADDIISRSKPDGNTVLFIDDMDYFLTRCAYDEQYRLRRFLNEEGAPILIATASKILPAMAEYEAPFFEGLKFVYLKPLPSDFLNQIFPPTELSRAQSIMRYLPPTINSLYVVNSIVISDTNRERDIDRLISLYSDRYRAEYQNLPSNSQQILNVLAQNEAGMTIPEIRSHSGLPTNILTSYLKRLMEVGIILSDRSIKRNTRYFIKDSLLSLWINAFD